jgi:membrane protein involved in D-alanine export
MLPFSVLDFFLLLAGFFLLLLGVKRFGKNLISYRTFLIAFVLYYLIFLFPSPVQAIAFVMYGYLVYYLFEYVFKINHKLPAVILLLAPMVLIKAGGAPDFISFAGLSYVTFRIIQIYLDNNRENKPCDVRSYFLFMLFPQTMLIGPIDRSARFFSDLNSGWNQVTTARISDGWQTMLLGLLQKFIVAEIISRYFLSKLDTESKEPLEMLKYMYTYSFYLYYDFAGYSNLAIGAGKMFGIDVPFNFNNPFIAVNPQDFWRRWHVTLSEWLKDYFFRPYYKWINGFKKFKNSPLFKQNSGLFLTFVIMGCWNGFKSYFIISGALFGLYSVVHNSYLMQCRKKGKDIVFGKMNPQLVRGISIFIMFNLVCFALYVFSGKFPFIK